MSQFFKEIRTNFDHYYENLYGECLFSSKAKKDIVGDHYEALKEKWISSYSHLDVTNADEIKDIKNRYKGVFNADIYIVNADTRELLVLEEDKGHYVDKCFLKRAISNAIETITISVMEGFSVPDFVLSCPTRYGEVKNIVDFSRNYLQPEVFNLLEHKFKYFPLCEHGRVNRKSYLKELENPFVLSESLCYNQHDFYANLGNCKERKK